MSKSSSICQILTNIGHWDEIGPVHKFYLQNLANKNFKPIFSQYVVSKLGSLVVFKLLENWENLIPESGSRQIHLILATL